MRRLALRQKSKLSQMRAVQRKAQRELEESSKDEIVDSQSEFCLLCRLNYRTPKAKHQLSETHRNMKKFLMPYCNTCRIAFKSPMVYESHRCSLEHLKVIFDFFVFFPNLYLEWEKLKEQTNFSITA